MLRLHALILAAALVLAATGAASSASNAAPNPVILDVQWSPNGNWLAFSMVEGDSPAEIHVVRRNGTQLRRIHTVFSGTTVKLSWSPDSRSLGIFYYSAPFTVKTDIRRPDGALVQRFDGEIWDWSHDGRHILLERESPSVVYIGDVRSGHVRRLGAGAQPTLSPDGRLIAFSRLTDGGRDCPSPSARIFVVRPDGRRLRQVSPDNDSARPGRHMLPRWSPDSKRVAYGDYPACATYEEEADAFTVPATGTRSATRLGLGWPDWSPKGHFLSLEKTFHYDPHLSIVTAGGDVRFESECGEDARWSPKGGRVAFSERCSWPQVVYLVETNGRGRRKLAQGRHPAWSRGLIAFARLTACGERIFVIAPTGRGLHALTACLSP